MEKSSDTRNADKIGRKHLTLDFGEMEYDGEKVALKGSLIFDFLHEIRSPNVEMLKIHEEKLKNWLTLHFSGEPLAYFLKLLKINTASLAYITPEWYVYKESNHPKLFWVAIYILVEWVTDNLDDTKEFRCHPEYQKLSRFIPVTLYKILTFKIQDMEELHQEIDQFGFFLQLKMFHDCFSMWFLLAQGLKNDLKMTPDQLTVFAESIEKQYDSNCWLDGPGNKQVDSESLHSTLRLFNCGGANQIKLVSLLEGLYEPDKVHFAKEKHLKRLHFLAVLVQAIVNDIVSLKKEVAEESHNNLILLWHRQGLSLEQSFAKAFQRHDEYLTEAEKIYKFVQTNYADDPAILLYAEIIIKSFSGHIQFCCECGRYGRIERTYETK